MPAHVDKPVLPPVLYRYRRLREDDQDLLAREINAIRDRMLYFSSYKALNDPMEGSLSRACASRKTLLFRKQREG